MIRTGNEFREKNKSHTECRKEVYEMEKDKDLRKFLKSEERGEKAKEKKVKEPKAPKEPKVCGCLTQERKTAQTQTQNFKKLKWR